MKLIFRILVIALALVFVSQIIHGIYVENFYVALIAAVVLGLLNLFLRPILMLLALPITLLTLGLFAFIINAGVFLIAAALVSGFSVSGFLAALLGSIIVSVASIVAGRFLV